MNCGPEIKYRIYVKQIGYPQYLSCATVEARSPAGAVETYMAARPRVSEDALDILVTPRDNVTELHIFRVVRQASYKIEAVA